MVVEGGGFDSDFLKCYAEELSATCRDKRDTLFNWPDVTSGPRLMPPSYTCILSCVCFGIRARISVHGEMVLVVAVSSSKMTRGAQVWGNNGPLRFLA